MAPDTSHLASDRRQARRQCPGPRTGGRAGLALRGQAGLPQARMGAGQATVRSGAGPSRPGPIRTARAALARPDRHRRPTAVDGGLVGPGPQRRRTQHRPARPAEALGRAVRADRGTAPVHDPATRESRASSICRCCGRTPSRRRRGGSWRDRLSGLAPPHDCGADRRGNQAIPLRSAGRPRPSGRTRGCGHGTAAPST